MMDIRTIRERITVENLFKSLVVLMRVLFGVAWLLAGITKITDKAWFSQPGVFLREYLVQASLLENVPDFYKSFIEYVALPNVLFFNYVIPIVQVVVGILIIVGLMTLPSILATLFMHVNFILSGNMNVISLLLYTVAFGILLSGRNAYAFSLDRHYRLELMFIVTKWFGNNKLSSYCIENECKSV